MYVVLRIQATDDRGRSWPTFAAPVSLAARKAFYDGFRRSLIKVEILFSEEKFSGTMSSS